MELGRIALAQHADDEALAYWQGVVARRSDAIAAESQFLIASRHFSAKDYEQALKEATGLMARRPDSELMPLITLKVARANLKLARWKKARELLQKIITDYPESFESNVARQLLEEKQYFTVQVGAYADKTRAEKMAQELLDKKEYAYVVETRSNDGKTLFRVRVGQLSTLKDARTLENKLSGQGYPTLIYP